MLTGTLPFQAAQMAATLVAILHNPLPQISALQPDAPLKLIDLIEQMLDKDRAQRIDSMRQIAARLEQVQKD